MDTKPSITVFTKENCSEAFLKKNIQYTFKSNPWQASDLNP
jgi:hypothetical protein